MRFKLVSMEQGDFDTELLLAALGALLVIGVAAARWLPAELLPPCNFHRLTGYPCLTCGGTRAAQALSRLDLAAAFRLNPLVALLLVLAGPYALWGFAARVWKWRRPRLELGSRREKWLLGIALLALVAANWIYLAAAGV